MADSCNPDGFAGSCREVPMVPHPHNYTPNEKPAPVHQVPPVFPAASPATRVSGDVPTGK